MEVIMMNNLKSLMIKYAGPVCGVFRMRHPALYETRSGQPYLRVVLEDMSGSVSGYAWQREVYEQLYFNELSCVYIEGQIRRRSDAAVVDLSEIQSIQVKGRENAVRLIPQSVCPIPWLMSFLEAAVSRLTIDSLKLFVESVLADDSIAFPFVSVPASLNHHHNYPGGLLKHSLECVQLIEKHHEFSREQFELGIVDVLFHDIGKILTMTHDMKRTSLGYNVDHDKLTLEILSPYLKQLDKTWTEGASELRYLLT
jgi:3'-5' exoribonuclease